VQRGIYGSLTEAQKDQEDRRPRSGAKAIAADTGPVTLAEARTLARAKHPKLAARAMRKGAVPLASPAGVGAEREKLAKERREELANRISEYKATMAIMKRRGARRARSQKAPKVKRESRNRKADRSGRYRFSARGIRGSTIRSHSSATASSRAWRIGSVSQS
jgi:hypothetical protein